jgi:hypothetical protein
MKTYTCKVCNKELSALSKNLMSCAGNDIFILPADHNYSIIIKDNGALFSEEVMVYNVVNDIGYVVDVNYDDENTFFAMTKENRFIHTTKQNTIYSLDNFDKDTFIKRFDKLMVLF